MQPFCLSFYIPFKPKEHIQGSHLNFEGYKNSAGFAQGVFHKSCFEWTASKPDRWPEIYSNVSFKDILSVDIVSIFISGTGRSKPHLQHSSPLCFREIQVAFRQNWERAANRTAINKHKGCQGCQGSKWSGSVWAEAFLINSSALRGKGGRHCIKAKADGPLLHTTYNTLVLSKASIFECISMLKWFERIRFYSHSGQLRTVMVLWHSFTLSIYPEFAEAQFKKAARVFFYMFLSFNA